VGKQILSAAAREIEDVYDQMVAMLAMFDPNTAEGQDLDDLAAVWTPLQFPARLGAIASSGVATLVRMLGAGPTIVPMGTVVAAPGAGGNPDINFETTAEATIPAGAPPQTVNVNVRCQTPGLLGNVGAAAITKKVTAVAGLDIVTNAISFTNGQDQESDSAFRTRIWENLWALATCTPWSLEYRAKTIGVAEHADGEQGEAVKVLEEDTPVSRRCVFANAVEYPALPGVTDLFIDDGAGFAGASAAQLYLAVANEVVITGAAGGEVRLQTGHWPIRVHNPYLLEQQVGGAGPWNALTEGVDYTLNRSNGKIVMTTALGALDNVRASYTYHLDLVRAVQYAVEGDPTDREDWPGWRPSGGVVFVRMATLYSVAVTADITVAPGVDEAAKATEAGAALDAYIATLGIGEDVIRSKLIERIMSIDGIIDVDVSVPGANLPIPDWSKASPGVHTIT